MLRASWPDGVATTSLSAGPGAAGKETDAGHRAQPLPRVSLESARPRVTWGCVQGAGPETCVAGDQAAGGRPAGALHPGRCPVAVRPQTRHCRRSGPEHPPCERGRVSVPAPGDAASARRERGRPRSDAISSARDTDREGRHSRRGDGSGRKALQREAEAVAKVRPPTAGAWEGWRGRAHRAAPPRGGRGRGRSVTDARPVNPATQTDSLTDALPERAATGHLPRVRLRETVRSRSRPEPCGRCGGAPA